MIPITRTVMGEEELRLVSEVLASGWIAQGPMVERFEAACVAAIGCGHAIAVSSGTAALHIMATALGIQPGDEVLLPAFTWVATANAVELVGGTPVFVDVDPLTGNLDPSHLAAQVTDRTVGIIPVHLFGLCADMQAVHAVASRHGLWVLEDAACALGSTHAGVPAGRLGLAGCFSFHPRKSITTGEGGLITTGDAGIASLCRSLRNHGVGPMVDGSMPDHPRVGFNYRLTDLQAAIGVAQLGRLDSFLAERSRIAAAYAECLSGMSELALPAQPDGWRHAWQSYVVLLRDPEGADQTGPGRGRWRDGIINALAGEGIRTRPGTHAPPLLSHYQAKYGVRADAFPGACRAAGLSLALPIFPGMGLADIQLVADRLRAHLSPFGKP